MDPIRIGHTQMDNLLTFRVLKEMRSQRSTFLVPCQIGGWAAINLRHPHQRTGPSRDPVSRHHLTRRWFPECVSGLAAAYTIPGTSMQRWHQSLPTWTPLPSMLPGYSRRTQHWHSFLGIAAIGKGLVVSGLSAVSHNKHSELYVSYGLGDERYLCEGSDNTGTFTICRERSGLRVCLQLYLDLADQLA